jgi:hypothetical protein
MRLAAVVLVLLIPAIAHADRLPSGRMSALAGADYEGGLGFAYGAQASWEPLPDGRLLGYEIDWDVVFSDFGNDASSITGTLHTVEMHLGARLRLAPVKPPFSISVGVGPSLLRASAPLPPSARRDYVGGFVSLGAEYLFGSALITLEARAGAVGGPQPLAVLFGVGFGV